MRQLLWWNSHVITRSGRRSELTSTEESKKEGHGHEYQYLMPTVHQAKVVGKETNNALRGNKK